MGDRAFYQRIFQVVVPIVIQNMITNVVGLIDNIMVGGTGTEGLAAVAISNQLLLVYTVSVSAFISGAAIMFLFHGFFISMFLQNGNNAETSQKTMKLAKEYLEIMVLGLFPYALSQIFSGTLREVEAVRVPMICSSIAVVMNTGLINSRET